MLKKLHYAGFIWVILFLVLQLTGCSDTWSDPYPKPDAGLVGAAAGAAGGALILSGSSAGIIAAGGIAGGIIGYTLFHQKSLVKKLEYNHVQVILLGDNLTLVLPSDKFFEPNSPLINPHYNSVLDQIIVLLNKFQEYDIKVVGYTDNLGWPPRNLAMSRQQAMDIADYLWRHGLNTRLIYPTGYGAENPIASNATASGRAMNRRVEITMRLITDQNVL